MRVSGLTPGLQDSFDIPDGGYFTAITRSRDRSNCRKATSSAVTSGCDFVYDRVLKAGKGALMQITCANYDRLCDSPEVFAG